MGNLNLIDTKYILPFIIIALFYFPGYISKDFIKLATREDGFYENLGALFFLLTAISFFVLAARPKLYRFEIKNGKYTERLYFLLFGILFLFAFGEEISWGQRIFDYATPEAIKKANMQGEFNLHNMKIFHHSDSDGIKKTGFPALLTMARLFYIFFIFYLLFIPLAYRYNSRFNKFIGKLRLPVPPLIFGVLFIFNILFGKMLRLIYEREIELGYSYAWGFVEVKETVFALLLFALPLSWMKFKNIKKGSILK